MNNSIPEERKVIWKLNAALFIQFHLIWWLIPVVLVPYLIINRHAENGTATETLLSLSTIFFSFGIYSAFVVACRMKGLLFGIVFLLIIDIIHSVIWLPFLLLLTLVRLLIPIIAFSIILRHVKLNELPYEVRFGFLRRVSAEKEGGRSCAVMHQTFSIIWIAAAVFTWFAFVDSMLVIPESAKRMECASGFRQIVYGLNAYHDKYGTLPPAWTVDSSEKPLHSWRVLLLPFLNEEDLYKEIRLNEPWDSEWNSQFHTKRVYRVCRTSPCTDHENCILSVVVGPDTFFPGAKPAAIAKGESTKIMIVERRTAVCWMDPSHELSLSNAMKPINTSEKGIGSFHKQKGAHFGYCDGIIRFEQIHPGKNAFLKN